MSSLFFNLQELMKILGLKGNNQLNNYDDFKKGKLNQNKEASLRYLEEKISAYEEIMAAIGTSSIDHVKNVINLLTGQNVVTTMAQTEV